MWPVLAFELLESLELFCQAQFSTFLFLLRTPLSTSLCFLLCFAAACLLEMEHSGSLNEMCIVDVTLDGCWEAILPKNCWHLY